MKNIFLFLFIYLIPFFALSQLGKDPLKKPQVWEQLVRDVEDSVLWSNYLAKPWKGMTIVERENIYEWKQIIKTKAKKTVKRFSEEKHHQGWEEEESIMSKEKIRRKEEKEKEKEMYLKNLEKAIVSENYHMKKLKKNVFTNFVLIDNKYKEEFKNLGMRYVSYYTKYPKSDYNIYQWVKEHDLKLKKLKMQKYNKLVKLIFNNN